MPRTFVSLAWLTLVVQFWLALRGPLSRGEGVLPGLDTYFSYFTILTNGFCALVMTAHLWPSWRGAAGAFFRRAGTTTTAAASIIIVATVYHAVLASMVQFHGLAIATDFMLHTLLPLAYLGFWWMSVPRGALALRDTPRWLAWPGIYAVYAFARGAILHEYPYFFIDVTALGYPRALLNSLGIFVAFLLVSAGLVLVNRFGGRQFTRVTAEMPTA